MANKRMISKQVVCTDEFLDMPLSSQALYFHLNINSDDDGFVSPKSIIRLIQANADDLNILIAKKFVIPFENKVVVIRHWWLHNTKQHDRYVPTEYRIYQSQTTIDDNKMITKCYPNKLNLNKLNKTNKKDLIEKGFKKYLEEKN